MNPKFKSFIQEIKEKTETGGSVEFECHEWSKKLELTRIQAEPCNNGWGSRMMILINETADKHQVEIHLAPAAATPQAEERLYRFFRKFEFHGREGCMLTRIPKKPTEPA